MTLTGEECHILLGGARIELKLRRNEVSERRLIPDNSKILIIPSRAHRHSNTKLRLLLSYNIL